ncbi:MAG: hypothetical protein ACJ757_00655 [Gaiellaceae bacterium]
MQNRVTPLSELIDTPARGLVYGNRGCLHDDTGRIRRRYNGRRWISCQLQFKDWRRGSLLQPGKFTELFFLDEATAFAAGHRPCALCRRADYVRFVETWQTLHSGKSSADAIDAQLHNERVEPSTRAQRHHHGPLDDLPDGVFVLHDGAPHLVLGDLLLTWSAAGYQSRSQRPKHTQARVITPPSLVAVLRTDWRSLVPVVHPSATTPAVRLSHRPPI